jgi:HEPN domain-containing protein
MDKAEDDWLSGLQISRARKHHNYNLVCWLTQQCAEKYLKARLGEAGILFKKTHDLVKLLHLVIAVEPTWNVLQVDLSFLSAFAVDYRYPGNNASKQTARDAIKSCRNVRAVIRSAFGLSV